MMRGKNYKSEGFDRATCFPPLSSESSQVLILGSFPGKLSLEKRQYYAHQRNSFWPVMGRLLDFDPLLSYQRRIDILKENKIALWDVLASCVRPGSLDSSIELRSMVINDFIEYFTDSPMVKALFFNGRKAEIEFTRQVLIHRDVQSRNLVLQCLPSTSPAMAMLSFNQKVEAWSVIKKFL
jgi:TDG/mug DNA glycosylase family protein